MGIHEAKIYTVDLFQCYTTLLFQMTSNFKLKAQHFGKFAYSPSS